ncbi:gfo/Idh/MocA family oxidoreductase [Geodermatophilus sp. TF02-6]|uniref:Gfo/Idh/MocA family protein n=1 Tax=Geodermatophilus sp. TF02-6 TaxID=2250575 RepID=UPI000DEA86BF|nr:Gfo/Idh/MocA family oxidoreductase [Geodermatophilus sp. TF02-6]RBY82909.1 gfo/Idh/MocA family oxidoreductase [Geodermatophilus sp. TF02-6]
MTTTIGLVGAGFIAGRHVDALTAIDGVIVAGVADPRTDRAEVLAARCGATPYARWEQLLDAEQLDALYVCVPPHAHGPVEEAAVDRGLPLFVEKPLGTDLAPAERLADRIDAAGLLTAVGYHWRYLDTLERARELLADRPARMVLGAWLDRAPRVDWWARQAGSGGQTVEQVTHLFDVARVLVGEVEGGWATGSRSPDGPGDILDVCTAALRFTSGAVGSFSNSCLLPRGLRIGVELVAPGLGLWLTEHQLVVTDADGERTIDRGADPFEVEDRAFVAAVRGEAHDVRTSYREALGTHRLAVAVATAAADGGTVRLSEAASPAGSAGAGADR